MAATYRLVGHPGRVIGWFPKTTATAEARRHVAGRVLRVDFGRLFGCQYVVVAGAGRDVRIVAQDGTQIPAVADWPTLTVSPPAA